MASQQTNLLDEDPIILVSSSESDDSPPMKKMKVKEEEDKKEEENLDSVFCTPTTAGSPDVIPSTPKKGLKPAIGEDLQILLSDRARLELFPE